MRPRVRFEKPPVVEVVCGVQFDPLSKLLVPQIGLFWATVRAALPVVEERAPLAATYELPPNTTVEMQLSTLPPLPRVWLIDGRGGHLVQIQRDRFHYNWKKVDDADEYPSYDKVIVEFEHYLELFRQFIEAETLGPLNFRQYELTYVNHIGSSNGLDVVAETALLVDHTRDTSRERFLPNPESFGWRTSYVLPEGQGRLHVQAQTALRKEGDRIVRLDLTARGIPSDNGEAARRPWFDLAHEWITHGFTDSTIADVQQKSWVRTQ